MMDYHIKYAHGFVFLFDVSCRESFENAKEMHEFFVRTAQALGEDPFSILVGNTECDVGIERRKSPRRREVQHKEARLSADSWSLEYLEVDVSSTGANIAALDYISTQAIKNSSKAGISTGTSIAYNPEPPRKLRLRRYLDQVGLGILLKSYSK